MKKIFLFAAAAFLAACSSDDLTVNEQPQAQLEEGAVGFEAYMQRATTRGGAPGVLTTNTDLTVKLIDQGFGVFGYYTDNNEYDQRSVPNFFYNQKVSTASWTYSPVKYWPNEYGSNAISEDQDKVTYFAYAPWIDVVPTSGKLVDTSNQAEEWGITSMTRNSNQGDPILKYIASFNAKRSVDLCWGVADNNDGTWPTTKEGTAQNIENGKPWIDVERPASTNQKVKFTFKHALAQLRVNIDAFVDGTDKTNALDPKTRIWVREVTFKGFALKGSLNLNNEDAKKPKWLDYGGQNELVSEAVIVYDGRKDGKEGVAGAVATNEKVLGLNPTLVQDGVYEKADGADVYASTALHVYGVDASGVTKTGETGYDRAGVTNSTVNLFEQFTTKDNQNVITSAADAPFHVIPTDEPFEIEIVYDVETVSENLAQNLSDGETKGTSVENRIRKEITFSTNNNPTEVVKKLEPGHSYALNLHLGMNSVKFDATVTDWIAVQPQDVELPLNAPQFAVGTPGTVGAVTIPFKGDYTFALTGLDGGESMNDTETKFLQNKAHGETAPVDGTLTGWNGSAQTAWTLSKNAANTSGVAVQTVTIYPNPNTTDQIQTAIWQGNQSGKNITMTFTQQAHPLFMAITGFANNGSKGEITLTRYNDAEHSGTDHWNATTGWLCKGQTDNGATLDVETTMPTSGNRIEVYRNGTQLTWEETLGDVNGGKFFMPNTGSSNYANKITIGDKLQVGDVIKVVIKTGDAPVETVTAIVGGISYPFTSRTVTYKATGTYDFAANYYGSSANPSITYSVTGSDATIDSNGKLTTTQATTSPVTVTATLATGSGLDFAGTATFELTIDEQRTKIDLVDENSMSMNFTEGASEIAANATLIADLKTLFKVVGDIDATPASCTITSVTGPSTGDIIVDGSGALKVGAAALTASTYTIDLTVSGTGDAGKYTDPAGKTFTLTVNVTTPTP